MTTAIEASSLTKSYGHFKALDGLELHVETGEVMGFLGPNGSGKSTTVRILMGLLQADGGTVTMLGKDPWVDAVALHQHVAYVPGDVALWPSLSGGEVLDVLAKLGTGLDPKRRTELIDRFELDPTKKSRTYSKGNRQKVALIAALAGHAELFIFDEPTAGLDPLMEVRFKESVRELVAEGKTVLLSSHILSEVEALCERVTIIRDGVTVEAGTLTEMRHLTATSIDVMTAAPISPIATLDGVDDFELSGHNRATFNVGHANLPAVMNALARLGIDSIISSPPTLEELFMGHYGTDARPGNGTGDGLNTGPGAGLSTDASRS